MEFGELEAAEDHLREAYSMFERLGYSLNRAVALVNLAEVCLARGEADQAWSLLEQCLEAVGPKAWPRVTVYAHSLAATLQLVKGRPKRASNHVRRALLAGDGLGDPSLVGLAQGVQADVALALGDRALAAQSVARAVAAHRKVSEGVDFGRAMARAGLVYAGLEDWVSARERLAEAEGVQASVPFGDGSLLQRDIDALQKVLG